MQCVLYTKGLSVLNYVRIKETLIDKEKNECSLVHKAIEMESCCKNSNFYCYYIFDYEELRNTLMMISSKIASL